MHSLLKRQIKRCFGPGFEISPEWEDFIQAVDAAYLGFDSDRLMLERSLDLSSQELMEANSESRAIFRALPDMLFRLDATGTILSLKTGNSKDLFIPAPQMCGKRIQDIPAPQISRLFQQAIERVQQEKTEVSIEYSYELEEKLEHYEARLTPLLDDQIVVLVRNITDKKKAESEQLRLENQLHQAQKIESVGRLAGGVAHDFNNMLQVILGNCDLAMAQVPSDHPIYTELNEIRQSAERSAALTSQLLAFARKQAISPKVLDLNDTISGILKMLQRLIGEDIQLIWAPGNNLWPVSIDPSQLDQILANLTVNARDAIKGVGLITIETMNVVVDDAFAQRSMDCTAGDYVLLSVRDSGCGIAQEHLNHLFEPFFTTKAPGQGTGLGLATVFGIIKQNNGFIEVSSRVDEGTLFKIYLPRTKLKPAQILRKKAVPAPRGTETVLLVEDEAQVLKLGQRILEQTGYKVLAAISPAIALDLAERHRGEIKLLITDVVMPGMNGRDLQQRIAATQPAIRCLFMSGYTADVIAHHGVLDEGIKFLQKPFTLLSLATAVRQVLDER